MLEERGAFAEAEQLRRRVLDGVERLWGPEHRETLTAVHNLATLLQRLGKFSEAALMCCAAVSGGWMVLHFALGQVGKNAGKQQAHFQIISDFVIYIIEVR